MITLACTLFGTCDDILVEFDGKLCVDAMFVECLDLSLLTCAIVMDFYEMHCEIQVFIFYLFFQGTMMKIQ